MAIRQRLHPNSDTVEVLRSFCDHERFLINLSVEQYEFASRYRAYASHPHEAAKSRQEWPWAGSRSSELTELRKELPWLRNGSQKAQQQALRLIDKSYRNWFNRPDHFRRPTFRRQDDVQGFSVVGAGTDFGVRKINAKWGEVRLPKLGWVKFRLTRHFSQIEEAKSIRVTLDRASRWHVSFTLSQPTFEKKATGAVVGIDRGIANTVATSDGALLSIPSLSPKEKERFVRLQRQLARQKKGSGRRNKTKVKIARLYAKQTDRKKDWIEQTTTQLVRDYDQIFLERLNVKGMSRSAEGTKTKPGKNVAQKRGLNRGIQSANWGALELRLKQKADAATEPTLVEKVSAHYTSQQCSNEECGHINKRNRESQAVFKCIVCGLELHADVNAAINIRERGMSRHLASAAGLVVAACGGQSCAESVATLAEQDDPVKREPLRQDAA